MSEIYIIVILVGLFVLRVIYIHDKVRKLRKNLKEGDRCYFYNGERVVYGKVGNISEGRKKVRMIIEGVSPSFISVWVDIKNLTI